MRQAKDHSEQIASTQFLDPLADIQSEVSEVAVDAGVDNLRVLYHDGQTSIPVTLEILTSTGPHRGVHMSRLVHASSSKEGTGIEGWLRAVCREVNKSQPGTRVTCRFELPYDDQFVPVAIRASEKGLLRYEFTAMGMTACPCSRRMIGIGHMQRAELKLVVDSKGRVDMMETISKLDQCFSAVPTEKMKRVEEAKKILEAQENGRFAEDLVRECAKRFPDSLYIRSRCFESIHAHDAVATWSKRPGWAPLV